MVKYFLLDPIYNIFFFIYCIFRVNTLLENGVSLYYSLSMLQITSGHPLYSVISHHSPRCSECPQGTLDCLKCAVKGRRWKIYFFYEKAPIKNSLNAYIYSSLLPHHPGKSCFSIGLLVYPVRFKEECGKVQQANQKHKIRSCQVVCSGHAVAWKIHRAHIPITYISFPFFDSTPRAYFSFVLRVQNLYQRWIFQREASWSDWRYW